MFTWSIKTQNDDRNYTVASRLAYPWKYHGHRCWIPTWFSHAPCGSLRFVYGECEDSMLADCEIGPIYSLTTGSVFRIFVGSHELLDELCDEKRFCKIVAGPLKEVRNGIHDGLFTAHPGEHNWELAHRILVPAFGPLSIRGMFGGMHDIATQLVMKWARRGPEYVIPVTDDFTRLTLDTLALCAMDYRFNSFYQNEMHPFVKAMGDFLRESGDRVTRLSVAKPFYRQQDNVYNTNIELLRSTGLSIVEARRKHPNDNKDLLNALLNGRDPKTGEGMNDESIIDNMITFLIAGHETTRYFLIFLRVLL